jgi:hypothetical protein
MISQTLILPAARRQVSSLEKDVARTYYYVLRKARRIAIQDCYLLSSPPKQQIGSFGCRAGNPSRSERPNGIGLADQPLDPTPLKMVAAWQASDLAPLLACFLALLFPGSPVP